MQAYICTTCGVQFAPSERAPTQCPVCLDERQYVGWAGQSWTTLEAMRHEGYGNVLGGVTDEPGLVSVACSPDFAIGQRALIVQTEAGNLMWDCVPCLSTGAFTDKQFQRELEAMGGIDAIAISHPHFYSTMIDWAQFFDVPIHIHADDAAWVMRNDAHVQLWSGEHKTLFGGLVLHRLGGHFAGGQVLYWPAGAAGKGALLSGDIIQVAQDRDWVSFMYSYPNLIPLPARQVAEMNARVQALDFARLYGAWHDRNVIGAAKEKVDRSAQRYMAALEGCFSSADRGEAGNSKP